MGELASRRPGARVRPARLFRPALPEKSELAIKRFTDESERLLKVLDRRLQESSYLAGDNYSIADVICYPWTAAGTGFLKPVLGPVIETLPAVRRWLTAVGERDAVKRGMAVPKT